jgi:N-acetylmuramidase
MNNHASTDDSWSSLAKSLAVEAAALRAVATVEAAGSGFLPGDPPRPKILFEGHAFHRLTGGRFAAERPISAIRNGTRRNTRAR